MVQFKIAIFVLTAFVSTINALPGDFFGISRRRVPITVPEDCKGKKLCSTKPDGYDALEDTMNKLLPKFLKENKFQNRLYDPLPNRELSPESDWHNCPYYTRTSSSYLFIHDKNETKMDIIVQTDYFRQTITTVECATDLIIGHNGECFQDLGLSALRISTKCVQTSADRSLYIYDPYKRKIVRKWYNIPVCCSCMVLYSL